MQHRVIILSFLLVACGDDDGTVDPDAGSDAAIDVGVDAGTDAVALGANGDPCTTSAECMSAFCVDDVCCENACDGTCVRCDGSADGTCEPVAADSDPDSECGAVACDAHYVAADDVCSFREDITDSACDGAGACQAAATLCPAQPAGDVQISCDTCASLAADTCVDTTAGACTLTMPFVDEFDGPDLDAGWTVDHLGGAPTFTLDGTLQITDSPPAATPSSTCNWIYDFATDKGNQIGRAVTIGTGDFVLEVDLSGSSDQPQLTLGGIALTNADDAIEYYAAFWDGGEGDFGSIQGGTPTSAGWAVGDAATLSASVRVERVGDTITTEVAGVVVETATSTADIQNLVILHTKHVCGGTTFEFGTVEIDRVSLCF